MKNVDPLSDLPKQPGLIVSEDMRRSILAIAKWASFLAIIGFVLSGITIVGAFTIGAAMNMNTSFAVGLIGIGNFSNIAFTIFCLAYAFAIFYPSLLLFKYSSQARYGILNNDQDHLNEGFAKLKSLFKYLGIITIITIAFYIVIGTSTLMRFAAQ